MARKRIYVLDTNVILADHRSLSSFGIHDVVLPFKVLEELDGFKKRQDVIGTQARLTIRKLDDLRKRGDFQKGIRINKGRGLCFVKLFQKNGELLDISIADNEIILTALDEAKKNPDRKVILVSRDINVRVKAATLGLSVEDYKTSQMVKKFEEIYQGYTTILVDDQIIDKFYKDGGVLVHAATTETLCANQFVMLISNQNPKHTALVRLAPDGQNFQPIRKFKERAGIFGVHPRNKEQSFALDLLLDHSVPVVTLTGRSGVGKTLLALAAGLYEVLETQSNKLYNKLIVTRPIQPVGKDIGYLPGTKEEKLSHWMSPILDNLDFLVGDKKNMERYFDDGTIEMEAMTFIRGRSLNNAYIILDEAQNLNHHELKTVITRVGENSKIILTGDIEQVDSIYLDATNNGLTYAIEKFRDYDIAGHVGMNKGERSRVATIASEIL